MINIYLRILKKKIKERKRDDIMKIKKIDKKEREKKEKERFIKFRRIIENYILSINLDDFSINDYLEFMNKFYSYEFMKDYREFYNYIENLNEEFIKILDL